MTSSSNDSSSRQERALLSQLSNLAKSKDGWHAVQLHLSKLQPYYREAHHQRAVAYLLEGLCEKHGGALFQVFNGDAVVIVKTGPAGFSGQLAEVGRLFLNDPLLAGDPERARELLWSEYALASEYDELVKRAEALAQASESGDADGHQHAQSSQAPLNARELSALQRGIEQADLSSVMSRQPICAVAGGEPPEAVFRELYVSIGDLAKAVLPDRNILANRWLFQELTRTLDRRVLAHLGKLKGDKLRQPFSVNLNVDTLLSPEFIQFDKILRAVDCKVAFVEVQLFDVVADIGRFFFARDFLSDLGYRICLDGLNCLSLPSVNREHLGIDLVKLLWNRDLSDFLAGPRGQQLRDAVDAVGRERTILCRCGSEQAIADGRTLGISLYQGYHIDALLAGKAKPDEKARQMGAALQRHRASSRPITQQLWE